MKDGGDGREPYRIKIGFALEKIKAAQRGQRDGRFCGEAEVDAIPRRPGFQKCVGR